MGQKVLVIGSGAREHTIAYTLLKAPSIDEVTVAPGNPGMLKDNGEAGYAIGTIVPDTDGTQITLK